MVMQCPDTEKIKFEMFEVINAIDDDHVMALMLEHQDVFYILMGKHPPNIPFQSMIKIWLVSSHYI